MTGVVEGGCALGALFITECGAKIAMSIDRQALCCVLEMTGVFDVRRLL